MAAHTPGPWTTDPKYPTTVRPTADSTDSRRPGKLMVNNVEVTRTTEHFTTGKHATAVCRAHGAFGDRAMWDIPHEQAIANARLIAAAPELLEALKVLGGVAPSGDELRLLLVGIGGTKVSNELHSRCDRIAEALKKSRAAIAKAEGGNE